MEEEIWTPIIGHSNYEISNKGNVKSIKSNKIILLKLEKVKNKYLRVRLSDPNSVKKYKRYMIHRLVALHFIPNPENKPQVNHINGIKTDNRVENLEWVTQSENMIHAYKIGLQKSYMSEECRQKRKEQNSKRVIDIKTKIIYPSIKDAAKSIGIQRYTLGSYLNGKIKKNKTTIRLLDSINN